MNLFSVSVLGWISGLGFMNLAKIYASPENLITIGYILNIWNVFLLLSTGINAVYHPLVKKYIIQNRLDKAKVVKVKTFFIYLSITFLVYITYFLIDTLAIFKEYEKINAVFSVIPYTLLLFLFSIFYYVTHPFYLANDKFGIFNSLNIFSHALWFLLVIILSFFGYENYIWFLVFLYFLKSITLFIYAEKKLMVIDN
ncbi:MAG: hypothetical protein ABF263_00445 [Polaribacter sp.]